MANKRARPLGEKMQEKVHKPWGGKDHEKMLHSQTGQPTNQILDGGHHGLQFLFGLVL